MHSPVERIEGKRAQLEVVVAVGTVTEEELCQLGDELAKKRDFLWTRLLDETLVALPLE